MRLKKLLSVVTAVAVALSAVVVAPVNVKTVEATNTATTLWEDTPIMPEYDSSLITVATDTMSSITYDEATVKVYYSEKTGADCRLIPGGNWELAITGNDDSVNQVYNFLLSQDDLSNILSGFSVIGQCTITKVTIENAVSDTPSYSASLEILPDEPFYEEGNLIIPTTGFPTIDSDVTITLDYIGSNPWYGRVYDTSGEWADLEGASITFADGTITCSLTSEAWAACLAQGQFVFNTNNGDVTGFTSVKLSYKSEGTDTFKQVSAADASNKHRERMVKLVKLSDLENAASVDFTFTTKEKEHTKSAYTYYTSITADGATLTPGTGWVFVTYAITGMPTEASLENISANIVNK